MLSESERGQLAGFVLNKFRGDPSLLPPGPEQLMSLTGVPMLGVIPWLKHRLPDEDGAASPVGSPGRPTIAVVRYPTASNLDEFKPLEEVTDLRWVEMPEPIESCDLVILPGSKHVAADLIWLVKSGIADAISNRAHAGRPILGICGGLQMLGECVEDEAGVDGSGQGLGLLPLRTRFVASKQVELTTTLFTSLPGPWRALSGKSISGYQIRHGITTSTSDVDEALPNGLGFVSENVLGIYLHGMFEEPLILRDLFNAAAPLKLDQVFDELADAMEEHLEVPRLLRLAGVQ